MRRMAAFLVLVAVVSAAGCKSNRVTRSGERGRWAVTRYLVRSYKIGQVSAYNHAKQFLAQKEYNVTENTMPRLLKGVAEGRSLIIRTRDLGRGRTQVEFKAGPTYDLDTTAALMDEFQETLPPAAQPK